MINGDSSTVSMFHTQQIVTLRNRLLKRKVALLGATPKKDIDGQSSTKNKLLLLLDRFQLSCTFFKVNESMISNFCSFTAVFNIMNNSKTNF